MMMMMMGDVGMCCCVKPLSMPPSPSCLFPPPSAPIPLLLTMLHIINQLWVGLPCKYPNESSFIKWLNGPDKSPNEEINNSVIVTVLILIRPSCSALIPAKRRPFFTVFSSACQHCCRVFFLSLKLCDKWCVVCWFLVSCPCFSDSLSPLNLHLSTYLCLYSYYIKFASYFWNNLFVWFEITSVWCPFNTLLFL